MNADNWAYCPKCLAEASANRRAVTKSYGKVSAEEYERQLAESRKSAALGETLREDYTVGMGNDGTLRIEYWCVCSKCDWSYKFTHGELALK